MTAEAPRPTADSSHADAVREFRRARVLAAAAAVFSEKGLRGGSLRSIASAAGCTTGAIYSQFSGKEELYAEVLAESLARLLRDVVTAAEGAPSPAESLRAATNAFFGYYREHPSEIALGLYLFQGVRPVGLGRELDARLNAHLREVLDIFSAAISRVNARADADLETAALFSYLMGLLIVDQTRRVRVTQRTAEELLDHYCETLLGRIGRAS